MQKIKILAINIYKKNACKKLFTRKSLSKNDSVEIHTKNAYKKNKKRNINGEIKHAPIININKVF